MEKLSLQRFLCAVFLAAFASTALYGCNPSQERSSPTFAAPETLTVEASMGGESPSGTGQPGLDVCSAVSTEGGLLLGKGIANDLSYSPDGEWLAVASSTGVYIYKSQEVNEFRLLAEGRPVSRISFSPDGALIAAGLSSGDICVWRVSDGQPVTAFPGRSEIRNLSFSSIDGILFSWSGDGEVGGWRVPEGTPIETVEGIGTTGPVAFSPDGSRVAVGWGDSVRLWRVSDGTFQTFKSPGGRLQNITFSPDGELVASAGEEKAIYLWEVGNGSLIKRLEFGPYVGVRDLAFSPDGEFLAAGLEGEASRGERGAVLLWRTSDGSLVKRLEAQAEGIMARLAFSPDGNRLAASTWEAVHIWYVDEGVLGATLEGYGGVNRVAFSPDGSLLASSSMSGAIHLWRTSDGELKFVAHDPSDLSYSLPVYAIAFSPDGKLLASSAIEGGILLRHVTDGQLIGRYEADHPYWVTSLSFSSDGQLMAAGAWQGAVWVSQVADALVQVVKEPEPGCENIIQVAFSPDDTMLAAATLQGSIYLWRTADGVLVDVLHGSDSGMVGLTFSLDGATLIYGDRGGRVYFRNVSKGQTNIVSIHNSLTSLALSTDGTLLATAGSNGIVQIWGITEQSLVEQMQFHEGGVNINSMAFSPDGGRIAAGSDEDGSIRIWFVLPKSK